ncbi:MAG: hypothetical protein JWM68_1888 [Verrucomicrobiales bacterium]|nr:hypothetical protein [Verrucomicrobiales bacterium]
MDSDIHPDDLLDSASAGEVDEFLRSVANGKVLFYPIGDKPKVVVPMRLSHLFDVYIFVAGIEGWTADTKERVFDVFAPDEIAPNVASQVSILSPVARSRLQQKLGLAKLGWFGRFNFQRVIGQTRRALNVYIICADPWELYTKLFTAEHRAPRGVGITDMVASEIESTQWAGFRDLLALGNPVPPFAINVGTVHMPWSRLWQRCPCWDYVADGFLYSLPKAIQVPSDAVTFGRISVTPQQLCPDTLSGSHAVWMPLARFFSFQECWPRGVKIVVDEYDDDLPALPQGADYTFIRKCLAGAPMADALRDIELVCSQHSIRELHIMPFGFPDELSVLRAWAESPHSNLKLTIHCETPGDRYSFMQRT